MGKFIPKRALTLKLVPLRNGGTGHPIELHTTVSLWVIPTFLIEKKTRKKQKKNDAPQGIKGAFSAVFDTLSFFLFKNNIFFLKEERPFFCGITRDYC